eukprot:TRINITY_DN733_c0_g1_i4.p1 TRINITY_DN733_c0_g1~~TRINITY_DN733_c0_g1_i4.p1  ORF type:complete len:186 (+),score=54.70 TRINITY_DN733_c0_g1_i4:117-674(+)
MGACCAYCGWNEPTGKCNKKCAKFANEQCPPKRCRVQDDECEPAEPTDGDTKIPLSNPDQSTTNAGGDPERAIDGSEETAWKAGSCMHTKTTASGDWWQADFDAEYEVGKVEILNRSDCCEERLNGAEILVGSTICVASTTDAVASRNEFMCQSGARGNKIRINSKRKKYRLRGRSSETAKAHRG